MKRGREGSAKGADRRNGFHRLRAALEGAFARWGYFCHDHPWWILLVIVGALAYLSTTFESMRIDTSNEAYLHDDDPARVTYRAFQEDFGRDERIVVLVESDRDIVNEDFLRQLETWHQQLEQVPQVDKVDSLINARLTYGREDELVVRDLLQDWPQTEAEFDALRARIISNPHYRNHFVNPDLTKTVLIVTPDTYSAQYSGRDSSDDIDDFDFGAAFGDDGDVSDFGDFGAMGNGHQPPADTEVEFITDDEIYALIDAIVELRKAHEAPDFRISMSGSPSMMHQLNFILGRDMFVFSGVGLLVIGVLLFAMFRSWAMVLLPVSVSALAVYSTFGLMCLLGMVITPSVQILPSLLLAVGVGSSVHIFTVYFQAVDRGESKREALHYALGHSGLAVLMTGLTTAGGLVSFVMANLKPIADIGIIAPIGILSTLVFSLALLPALIAVLPLRSAGPRNESSGLLHRFLMLCADVSTLHPRRVVGVWFGLIVISLLLISQIRPSHYPLHWFPEGSEIRDATEIIDAHFGGATFTEIVVDTGSENGLHDPDLLHAVDRAMQFTDELQVASVRAGKATSLLDINKELHQALNGNDPAYYVIPNDRDLIAQELLLFENSGSDDLKDLVDTTFSKMRITVKMPFVDGIHYADYLETFERGFREIIGDRAEVTFTGVITLLAGSVKVLMGDTIRAYLLAFIIILPLMMLIVGSVRIGFIAMIPNLAPIAITLALMPLLGIPLDAFTILVGSIALGLAVDDTIHFMHNFHRYYADLGDVRLAVRETLRTTGRALLITTLVLSSAFFVYLFGTMHNLQAFGLLTGICIILAFLADALLAPALMTLVAHRRETQLKENAP
jgi:predicted RND superfamily exporter protein